MERGRKMHLNWLSTLLLFLLGVLIISYTFRRAIKKGESGEQINWQKQLEDEHALQFVRGKPFDESLLIKIDFNEFPVATHEACKNAYLSLLRYATFPMINLKDQTNFELKKTYGPQIVEKIDGYERNFNQCMQLAINYAELLMKYELFAEAQQTLEVCVKYHCDLSKCYILLIDLYRMQQNEQALHVLKETIQKEMGNSPFLKKILRHFNDNLKESV